jgi:hypothetical protein
MKELSRRHKELSRRHAERMSLHMLIRRVQYIFRKLLKEKNLDVETYRTRKKLYNKRKRGCVEQTEALESLFSTLKEEHEREEKKKKKNGASSIPKKTKISVQEAEFETPWRSFESDSWATQGQKRGGNVCRQSIMRWQVRGLMMMPFICSFRDKNDPMGQRGRVFCRQGASTHRTLPLSGAYVGLRGPNTDAILHVGLSCIRAPSLCHKYTSGVFNILL